ncbi:MAG: acetamidase/formamidase family protein [Ilumatobacteraceae bacterium]
MYWGYIDQAQPAVLEVDDGDVIRVEAITHHAGGTPDLLMDEGIRAIWDAIAPDTRGPGVHILTGPIHVRGAEPGDALAVTILEMTPRLPFGSNWRRTGGSSTTCTARSGSPSTASTADPLPTSSARSRDRCSASTSPSVRCTTCPV